MCFTSIFKAIKSTWISCTFVLLHFGGTSVKILYVLWHQIKFPWCSPTDAVSNIRKAADAARLKQMTKKKKIAIWLN